MRFDRLRNNPTLSYESAPADIKAIVNLYRDQSVTHAQRLATLAQAHACSGVIEVGGALAVHMLFEGSGAYFSHDFVPLLLTQGLQQIENKPVAGMVVIRQGEVTLRLAIETYTQRKTDSECWFGFIAWHGGTTGDRRREFPCVPQIQGPRLPNETALTDPDGAEQYARIAEKKAAANDHFNLEDVN
ncbi:hypothetical protein DFS34DRAFT_517077 [Phlyctochytrium arcticum]|nr:hypothetical protein DFS34DRAFT_517077 [Phlyctochytrium arcticum]